MALTRRDFVRVGSLWVAAVAFGAELGCSGGGAGQAAQPKRIGDGRDGLDPPRSAPTGSALDTHAAPLDPKAPYGYSAPAEPPAEPAGEACHFTETNIEGPYYRQGAPMKDDLTDGRMPGVRLAVSGRVFTAACAGPLAGALIDIWQADKDGRYDNDGHDGPRPGALVLRGKVTTNARGEYRFRSIVPGRYLNGAQYRPAHVHVKVSAPGHRALTTQLYFDGDPYNGVDPFIKQALVMKLEGPAAAKTATFDFVLRQS